MAGGEMTIIVILSAAKDLVAPAMRSFAALRMTISRCCTNLVRSEPRGLSALRFAAAPAGRRRPSLTSFAAGAS